MLSWKKQQEETEEEVLSAWDIKGSRYLNVFKNGRSLKSDRGEEFSVSKRIHDWDLTQLAAVIHDGEEEKEYTDISFREHLQLTMIIGVVFATIGGVFGGLSGAVYGFSFAFFYSMMSHQMEKRRDEGKKYTQIHFTLLFRDGSELKLSGRTRDYEGFKKLAKKYSQDTQVKPAYRIRSLNAFELNEILFHKTANKALFIIFLVASLTYVFIRASVYSNYYYSEWFYPATLMGSLALMAGLIWLYRTMLRKEKEQIKEVLCLR